MLINRFGEALLVGHLLAQGYSRDGAQFHRPPDPTTVFVVGYNDRFVDNEYNYESKGGDDFQGVTLDQGLKRQLDVSTVEDAQGAAGYAYATGTVVQAVESSHELNRKFKPAMLREWDSGRTFSSLLCVPISGGPNWLPLGVGFLSSNRKAPFWTGFPAEETVALQRLIRSTFKQLTGFSGHHG